MTTNHATSTSGAELLGQYIGNYRLVRLLGEGGMGMVFAAVHAGVGGQAAIKILRAEVASRQDITTRFFNEAKAANSISHPGIVRVFDCGYTANGIAYLAMEFLEGESLGTRLARVHWLSVSDALRVARQIASALQAAHQRRVIHRDLKPDNVMLVPDPELPGGERAKILDFGIAKISEGASGHRTRSDMVMGTPTYMAPEQCHGAKHVTEKSDVYSLGVILYQMLAGRPPFVGSGFGELAAMHLKDAPPPLLQHAPHVAPELAALVHLLLEKQETQRPSMESVVSEFLQFMDAVASASSAPTRRSLIVSPSTPALKPMIEAAPQFGVSDSSKLSTIAPDGPRAVNPVLFPAPTSNPAQSVVDFVGRTPTHQESPTQPLFIAHLRRPAADSATDQPVEEKLPSPLQLALPPQRIVPFTPLPHLEPLRLATSDSTTARQPILSITSGAVPGIEPAHVGGRTLTWAASESRRIPKLLHRGSLGVGVGILTMAVVAIVWRIATSSTSASTTSRPSTVVNDRSSSTLPAREASHSPNVPTAVLYGPPTLPMDAHEGAPSRQPSKSIITTAPTAPGPLISPKMDDQNLAKGTVPPHPAQLKALSAWKAHDYAGAILQALECTKARPQSFRCSWLLGMAACHSLNYDLIESARGQLIGRGKQELAEEVVSECSKNKVWQKSDGKFGPAPVQEKPAPAAWITISEQHMRAGRFENALRIAKAYTYADPLNTWQIVGKCACALQRLDDAAEALNAYHDTSSKNEILNFCASRGFEYDAQRRKFKKR